MGVSARWLAAPTRFATLKPAHARLVLAAVLLATLAALLAFAAPAPEMPVHIADQGDVVLYQTIVAGMRGGGDYYSVAADALRGGDLPLRPFTAFRLPTLAVLEAALPPLLTLALLYALAAGTAAAWYFRLRAAFAPIPARLVALALLAGGMAASVRADLVAFHELWAGLLVALSLAVRREAHWIEAVALGLIAMLLRETAALYVAIMALLALAEGARREALGWGATLVVFAGVVALHAHAVAEVLRPTDLAASAWGGMLGYDGFVRSLHLSSALHLAPLWLAAALVGLALFGWAAWGEPLALRVLTVFAAYAALLGLFARPDTLYEGLMVAPAFLVGLAFVPDAVRDLVVRARDRRRITVTRVTR